MPRLTNARGDEIGARGPSADVCWLVFIGGTVGTKQSQHYALGFFVRTAPHDAVRASDIPSGRTASRLPNGRDRFSFVG